MTNLNLTINGAKASLNGNYVNFSVPMVALTGGDGDTSHYLYTIGYQSNPSKIISMEQVNYETESQFTWSNGWSTAGYSYNPAHEIWSSPYFYCIKGKDASGNVGYTLPLKATKNSDGTYSITGWENGSSTTNSTSYSLSGASSVIADAPLTLSVQAIIADLQQIR
ncbi:hypothetical protein [Acetobacter sp.]|uniref:hypothetical protein n=1 Tax=Acetobacter sp. TaxID=440 RepID=UPI0039E8819B